MRVFSSLDLIRAHPWSSSFFTTYALSLSFFEAVVLDSLVRQHVGQNLILADVEGVRAALAEHGARSVGRSYEVEPVAVNHGCFHPKLMALTSPTEAHLVVGSGNLTFGGWGSNFECVEHLHPAFAADAFDDAADFLESLATARTVKHAAVERCAAIAKDLRLRSSLGARTGRVRIMHNLERSIFDQLVDVAEDLGGAQRLTVASPFYDNGVALDLLCKRFGLDHAFVHVHEGGTVAGWVGSGWPVQAATRIEATAIELFTEHPPRLLHAKALEVVCRRGRVVLSGSANATTAALDHGRNVELCVARIEHGAGIAWRLGAASTPTTIAVPVPHAPEDGPVAGVLRAVLHGEELRGWILTSFPCGPARVFRLTRSGNTEIGGTVVSQDGRFLLRAQDLEQQAWTSQRLILRVASSAGAVAEGFVSFADLAEIMRRAGAIAPRLFAVLAGTETPEDVAAMMSWFHENPKCLSPDTMEGAAPGALAEANDAQVLVSSLLEPESDQAASPYSSHASNMASWRRFMGQILACFREQRGPISANSDPDEAPSPEDETDRQDGSAPPREHPGVKRAMWFFDQLFEVMLNAPPSKRDIALAFRIAQYVSDRLEPDAACVKNYLDTLVASFMENPPPADDREIASAAILVASAAQITTNAFPFHAASLARRKLLRLGADLEGAMPDIALAQGFARILVPDIDATALWASVRAARTAQEEVRAYRMAGSAPISKADFPYLGSTPEWPSLAGPDRKAISFMPRFQTSCPVHYIALPSAEASRLHENGVGRALNCCGRILLCEEV